MVNHMVRLLQVKLKIFITTKFCKRIINKIVKEQLKIISTCVSKKC